MGRRIKVGGMNLDFLYQGEAAADAYDRMVANGASPVVGFSGLYLNYSMNSNVRFIVRAPGSSGTWEEAGMDVHHMGNCVWDCRVHGADLTPPGSDPLRRRCMVTESAGGGSMAVVNVVNADVLPSYKAGETIRLQVAGYAKSVDFYPDEAAYLKFLDNIPEGWRSLYAGTPLLPIGRIKNMDSQTQGKEVEYDIDDLMFVHGEVMEIRRLCNELYPGGITGDPPEYLGVRIATPMGELELFSPEEIIEPPSQAFVWPGAIAAAMVTLTGNAAIGEYADGIISDRSHGLRLLRRGFEDGDLSRFESIRDEFK